MTRCPRCSGAMIRDLGGPSCLSCGHQGSAIVIVAQPDTRTCAGCGSVFCVETKPRGMERRYCDDNCRKRASKRRQRLAVA